ncbi:MAG: XdhC family protein [Gammaproteobacteria bacterium]
MKDQMLQALLEARQARRPVVLVTRLDSGQQTLISPDSEASALGISEAILRAAQLVLQEDRTELLETELGPVFFHVFNPPLKMIIVGAVHIAQCLVPMAQLTGYQVVVVDPRRRFATTQRLADVEVLAEWPQTAFGKLILDNRTAVITLTHDPKLDDAALHLALTSSVFYIGSLGSRRTHAARLKRLARAGLREKDLARIHAPVGLSLGGRSPAEIAVAILAEVIQVRYADRRSTEQPGERLS